MAENLGFKCGIEIHQRLATGRKLFCNCSSELAGAGVAPSGTLRRRLRAVVGELGVADRTALFEQARGREFEYQLFEGHDCLVEADEEPPFPIDGKALDAALTVALLLNAVPVDEIVVMRKTVVDGSAVSGFQRTALVATGGFVETSKGKVGIQTVCLEEDSAGIVEKEKGGAGGNGRMVVYRLDRLGIPLIEVATDSSIKDGAHAAEVAEKIGMLLRSTGLVMRGLGSIRQDLNVSIAGGPRVEIKGAQELEEVAALVIGEAQRQGALHEIKVELAKRKAAKPEEKIADVTSVFAGTNCSLVGKALQSQGVVLGVRLASFAGLLGRELLPNHRFGTELSSYARAAGGVGGIIHSDEELGGKYNFSEEELKQVEKLLGVKAGDAWVLVAAPEQKARGALSAVVARARMAFVAVPEETRRAEGQKSVYMRPLPGGARMYPETDLPKVSVSREKLESLGGNLPLSFDERRAKYVSELGLNEQLADRMARSSQFSLFESLLKTRAEPSFVAATLLESLTSLRRQGVSVDAVSEEALFGLFELFAHGKLVKAAVPEALVEMAKGKSALDAVREKGLEKVDKAGLKKIVSGLLEKGVAKERVFGEVMRSHRLNVDAGELKEVL